MIDPFPMITAANTLEASPKPSYGPRKASERYLDDEDLTAVKRLKKTNPANCSVEELLQALETLRTHLRKKYYAG